MISSIGSAAGAKNLVANVDAVGAGDLRRLMGKRVHVLLSLAGSVVTCMARFPAPQKAFRGGRAHRPVDRPAATVWYGPKYSKRGKALVTIRRAPMADKGNDPAAIWQSMIGEMEKGFNSFANQAMASPEFSKVMNQVGGVSAGAQKQLGEMMEKYLVGMNLPSRAQLVGMAERIQSIEGQLNEIKALLHQIHNNSSAPDGGYAKPKPPRTKRPPAAEGEQK
jgi:hypothetical protein